MSKYPGEEVTIASKFKIVEFTVPASNGTPNHIANLLLAASTPNNSGYIGAATNEGLTMPELASVVSVQIMGEQSDGTERAKIRYSSVAAGTRYQVIEAGAEKEFPCTHEALATIYLLNNAASAETLVCAEVYMSRGIDL
jgi:hypothetical protein